MSQQAQRASTVRGDARSPGVRRVLVHVLVLNALVVVIKIAVGARTGALTVWGAALESALDTLNNVIGMALVGLAARAPDEDHPYGHDKFETLGALGIVGFLSISCFELLRQGTRALLGSERVQRTSGVDALIMLATLGVNLFVVMYERRRGRALSSAFLVADAEHTQSDILVTLLALASLGLTHFGWGRVDAWLAIFVALIIAWSGYRILRESIPILVDQRAVHAQDLRRVVRDIPEVVDVRNVRSRFTASGNLFAELTIVVAGDTTVEHAHAIADEVEAAIGQHYGASEVTVHVEPI